jgi:hypothetical protein
MAIRKVPLSLGSRFGKRVMSYQRYMRSASALLAGEASPARRRMKSASPEWHRHCF